jgi:7,8-dihydropterin-6-yl-methyl-4-(beta-D-ribofuranosyl)aminobenzene 5'-phosphate synthase
MSQKAIVLPEVDSAKVKIVVDNSLDLLMAGSEAAHRFPMRPDSFASRLPVAEHGFSVLIQVTTGEKNGTILFDTALTPSSLLNNIDALDIDVKTIQAIVLSHGHADHAMGLPGLVGRLGKRGLPLVLHPEARLERRIALPNGDEIGLPAPKLSDYRRENIELVEETGPSMLVDNMVLISGKIERTTEFEKGLPGHQSRRNGRWEPDPLIMDDQCAIIHVRGKGLVILSGCGHSGLINTIRHAQALTGVQDVYAVIGGFHLTGALFAPIIPPTVAALKKMKPRYLMPGHCTGWSALHQIAHAMPDAFIPNSVGTTLVL